MTTPPQAADTRAVRRDPASLELLTALLVGWGINILTLRDRQIEDITVFRTPDALARFGLPSEID